VQLDGTLAVDVGFGAQESVIAAVGVGYHGEFMPYAHFDAESDSHYQLPTGTVGATVGGDLGVRMLFYGIVGPEVRGLGWVSFTGGTDPTAKVSYKFRVAVGASIVLDVVIASWDWGPYLFIDKTLNQGSSEYHPPTVAISWPTEGQTISLGSVLVPRLTAVAMACPEARWTNAVRGHPYRPFPRAARAPRPAPSGPPGPAATGLVTFGASTAELEDVLRLTKHAPITAGADPVGAFRGVAAVIALHPSTARRPDGARSGTS